MKSETTARVGELAIRLSVGLLPAFDDLLTAAGIGTEAQVAVSVDGLAEFARQQAGQVDEGPDRARLIELHNAIADAAAAWLFGGLQGRR